MDISIRVEPAREEDMPRCVQIMNAEFAFLEALEQFHGPDTPENRIYIGKAHFEMQRDHMSRFPSVPVCVKCVQTTTADGGHANEEKIVGYGEWYVYDRPRTDEELAKPSYYDSFAWVPDADDRVRCRAFGAAGRAMRARVLGGTPHGQVRFLCVDAAHQRRGIGSAIVRWGMERCAEIGVAAYLESSAQGAALYEKLGFTKLVMPDGTTSPHYTPMIWNPPTAAVKGG